jgi:hypothetical protein
MCSLLLCKNIGYRLPVCMFFNYIHPDLGGFGISAMKSKLTTGVFRGRPFGGVVFLWRKSISRSVEIVCSDDTGRCLGLSLECNNQKIV